MLAIGLALGTNIIYNTGYVIAKAAVQRMPPLRIGRPGHLTMTLWRSPLWLASLTVELVGLVFQIVALSQVPMFVAEMLFLASLPFLLILTHIVLGERLGHRERVALTLVVASLAVVALSLDQGEGDHRLRVGFPVVAGLTACAVLVSLLVFALNGSTGRGQRRTPKAGVAYGFAAGMVFGVMGLQSKALAQAYQRPTAHGLATIAVHSPYTAMMLATGALGIGGLMVSLQRCRASIVIPVMLVVSNWILMVAGTVVFGSNLPSDGLRLILRIAGLSMTIGVLAFFPHNDPTPAGFDAHTRTRARHERARRGSGPGAPRPRFANGGSTHDRRP